MRFEVGPDEAGTRLDIFLSTRFGDRTRSQFQSMNRRGDVRVSGSTRKDGYRLRVGDVVEVSEVTEPPVAMTAEAIPILVHHDEPGFAVVEKPAGIVVHPGAGKASGTLANALMARFPELSDVGGPGRPGIVHRLDRWTSGLILIARTNDAHVRLARSFELRNVRKSYIAAVHGRMAPDKGTIDLGIGRHRTQRTRMAVDTTRGRSAISEYRVVETIPAFSLLEVSIRTGRTHQIRVHLAAIGHPVLGDTVYGEKRNVVFERRHGVLGRYFLHAARLGFPHPETGEWVEFRSPLPETLRVLWQRLSKRDSDSMPTGLESD
jgi:23S rRNA pseudouridine1911/1915/1917 synthase